MIQAFLDHPLLLLFVTVALGYGLGLLQVKGFKMGVAAVLFVGLFFGSLHPDFYIPDIIIYFALSVYIYSVGLASAPTFFKSMKQNGMRDIGLIFMLLTITVIVAGGLHFIFGFFAQTTAGLYAGATTNTAAMAGLIDFIGTSNADDARKSKEVVAAYSIAYPVGILGTMLALMAMKTGLKINFKKEEESLADLYPVRKEIIYVNIRVENSEYSGKTIREIKRLIPHRVVFGRLLRGDQKFLSTWDTVLMEGDKVIITGSAKSVRAMTDALGHMIAEDISQDESEYINKRFFVTNADVAGQPISALGIEEKFAAVPTRIQRGDLELLPSSSTILELGDMVRFVMRKENVEEMNQMLGNAYEALGRINLLTFGLGMALGVFVGLINFQLPGGVNIKLGYAGGPILVALILGALRRTGPIVWTLSHSVNHTFTQFGLSLLLAAIGVNAGHTFLTTMQDPISLYIGLAALTISFTSACVALFIGYKFMRIPFSVLMGMASHQPALLDYSMDQTRNKLPVIGFTLMMPLALIMKIIFVQILYLALY